MRKLIIVLGLLLASGCEFHNHPHPHASTHGVVTVSATTHYDESAYYDVPPYYDAYDCWSSYGETCCMWEEGSTYGALDFCDVTYCYDSYCGDWYIDDELCYDYSYSY